MPDKELVFSVYGDYHRVYSRGIRIGTRINACPILPGMFLMTYVMMLTDDYLVFPADPGDVRADACPRRDDVTDDLVAEWLDACAEHGLISLYHAEGSRWGVFIDAPPKTTKNGKYGKRFPHPPASCAVWSEAKLQWSRPRADRDEPRAAGVPTVERPGVTKESKPSKESKQTNDNRTEQNRTDSAALPPPAATSEGDGKEAIGETVAELWFAQGVPRGQRSRFHAIVRDLLEINATVDGVRGRVKQAKKQWTGGTCTPEALIKHWTELGDRLPKRTDPAQAARDQVQKQRQREAEQAEAMTPEQKKAAFRQAREKTPTLRRVLEPSGPAGESEK